MIKFDLETTKFYKNDDGTYEVHVFQADNELIIHRVRINMTVDILSREEDGSIFHVVEHIPYHSHKSLLERISDFLNRG